MQEKALLKGLRKTYKNPNLATFFKGYENCRTLE